MREMPDAVMDALPRIPSGGGLLMMRNDLVEELSKKSWGADGTRIIAPQAGD